MKLTYAVLLLACLAFWMAGLYYYTTQYDGCWCGPFANWVPSDGAVHATDAAKFNHQMHFLCTERACVERSSIVAASTHVGQYRALFLLRCAALVAVPTVATGAVAAAMLLRKKLVVPGGNAADVSFAK